MEYTLNDLFDLTSSKFSTFQPPQSRKYQFDDNISRNLRPAVLDVTVNMSPTSIEIVEGVVGFTFYCTNAIWISSLAF